MIERVTFQRFTDAFEKCGRGEQFSPAGLRALWEWIEGDEEARGEDRILDPIALCCEWAEYDTFDAIREVYNDLPKDEAVAMKLLTERTEVIEFNSWRSGGWLVQNF